MPTDTVTVDVAAPSTRRPSTHLPSAGFRHTTLAQRVSFGIGQAAVALQREVGELGAQRIMLVSGSSQRAVAARLTADLEVHARIDTVAQHVPIELADGARAVARTSGADLVVAIGGGSTIGLAKAVALTTAVPIVAVPTTYAGSEATDVWGITEHSRKRTGADSRVLPVAVVYDADLVRSLPRELSLSSGLNALAHAVDALWGPRADPINQGQALQAVGVLARALRAVHARPGDPEAHQLAQYGAYLAAVAFASAGSGMHHKICHVLGGAFGLPHAPMHAVVLPHVLAHNAVAVPDLTERVGLELGSESGDAVQALEQLRSELGTPRDLAEIGLRAEDLAAASELVLEAIPRSNPRPVTRESVHQLLLAAWRGTPASTVADAGDRP